MMLKTTFAVIALTLAPALALAEGGCHWEKTRTTASACAEGTVFDAATGTCVAQPSS